MPKGNKPYSGKRKPTGGVKSTKKSKKGGKKAAPRAKVRPAKGDSPEFYELQELDD